MYRNVIISYTAVGLGVDWDFLVSVGFILFKKVTVDFSVLLCYKVIGPSISIHVSLSDDVSLVTSCSLLHVLFNSALKVLQWEQSLCY